MYVNYVNNDGGGFTDSVYVEDGTTIETFFRVKVGGSPSDYSIRVNGLGARGDYVLREGDRVTISPTQIKGA